jgi:hypothetical protein
MRPVGRVLSPMSDGSHELSQRGYSLHQSQLVGNEKRRTEGLRTKRRSVVTWGSPTRGDAQGDGVAIVAGQQESVDKSEVPQEARLRKRWLTRMCQETIVGVALKRRGPLESLVHGNRACHGSGEGRWKRTGGSQYLAGGLSYSGDV